MEKKKIFVAVLAVLAAVAVGIGCLIKKWQDDWKIIKSKGEYTNGIRREYGNTGSKDGTGISGQGSGEKSSKADGVV